MKDTLINHIELEGLLNNLKGALKKYSIKELNDAILDLLNKDEPKKRLVDATLKSVCEIFNITQRILLNTRARGKVQDARMICYEIMHNELKIPLRYISLIVFKRKSHGSVTQSLKHFKELTPEKIQHHKELLEKYHKAKESTLNYLIIKI
jgi:chromosomal replication initiation ATPase DnaA